MIFTPYAMSLRNLMRQRIRFRMEEMADAGEAFGELLDLIFKDLRTTGQDDILK